MEQPIKEQEEDIIRMQQKEKLLLECSKCRYRWIPRSKRKPIECPDCKSRYWEE